MIRASLAFVMLALSLFAFLSLLQVVFTFEEAWDTSSASQLMGTFGFKSAAHEYIQGVGSTLEHRIFKGTLRFRFELRGAHCRHYAC